MTVSLPGLECRVTKVSLLSTWAQQNLLTILLNESWLLSQQRQTVTVVSSWREKDSRLWTFFKERKSVCIKNTYHFF